MGFMNSYKRLDNLCRDMNGIGVTGYIHDMECKTNAAFYVPGWKEDYLHLKQYRYIRNQIAHENDIDEDNICSEGDDIWIEEFYQRIMVQNDPLALYYKAVKSYSPICKPTMSKTPKSPLNIPTYTNANIPTPTPEHKHGGCGTMMLFVVAVLIMMLFILYS